ncbi:MucBP domain-containing protein [Levilactobacillus lanxiensis]|uniref:MucBP domain-containing protein n=1 Tax=Levilactobacillus lanxiensis TaxID=2799568 RepID=A0ABW4D6U4_9LACO|nr:MucBP domain-containing protein [Levilactobacillus lanxiensis]
MKHAVIGEAKEHYKAYKAGKQWIYACITVVAVGLGLAGANVGTAQAATTPEAEPAASQVVETPAAETPADDVTVPEKQNEEPAGDKPVVQEPVDKDDVENENDSNDDVNMPKTDVKDDVKAGEETNGQTEQEKPATGEQDVKTPGTTVTDPTTTEPDKVVKTDDTHVAVTPNDSIKPATPPVQKKMFMMARAAVAPVITRWPNTLPIVHVDYTAEWWDNVNGKNAAEWMPDANLRQAIEGSINQAYSLYGDYLVTDENLWTFAGFDGNDYYSHGVDIYNSQIKGPIATLEGLQYFTNLRQIELSDAVPLSGMIDFSFAPNLNNFRIYNESHTPAGWNVSADYVLSHFFSKNQNLQYLWLNNLNLTGSFPDTSNNPNLYYISLDDNQLTGSIPDLSNLRDLMEVNIDNNQMSGQLPDMTNWTIDALHAGGNRFSGELPDISMLGALDYSNNMISTGITPGSYTGFVVSSGQSLVNKHYTLTNGNNSFDPTQGTFSKFINFSTGETDNNVQLEPGTFKNGNIVVYSTEGTEGVTDHNAWAADKVDASDWFTIKANPDNPMGFLLVAKPGVKTGNYVIKVVTKGGSSRDTSAWIDFSVTNKMTNTVTPVTPNTPEPDAKTGTITVISVSDKGKVLKTQTIAGNIGDTFNIDAPSIAGYKVTGNATATGTYTADGQTITFTYTSDGTVQNGGDAATIDDTTPTDKVTAKTTKGGAADTLTGTKQGTKQTQQAASQKQAPVTTLKASGQAATVTPTATPATDKQVNKTVLPQTNESNGNYVLAGIATLIGALGLAGLKLRKRG